jgi:hypothetical protein
MNITKIIGNEKIIEKVIVDIFEEYYNKFKMVCNTEYFSYLNFDLIILEIYNRGYYLERKDMERFCSNNFIFTEGI